MWRRGYYAPFIVKTPPIPPRNMPRTMVHTPMLNIRSGTSPRMRWAGIIIIMGSRNIAPARVRMLTLQKVALLI